jgi:hypothetical protein
VDQRAEYEELWEFATREERFEELRDRLRHDEPPPMGTTARDTFDRVKVLGPLLVAHRVLRNQIANDDARRAEALRFLQRGRDILDELDRVNDHGDGLCAVLGAPVGFAESLG